MTRFIHKLLVVALVLGIAGLHPRRLEAQRRRKPMSPAPRTLPNPMTHGKAVWSVPFSPDGKTLASAGDDRTIKLWEVATGKELARIAAGHREDVHCVALSPDGKTLASASWDQTA